MFTDFLLIFQLYPALGYVTVFVLGLCLGSFTSALSYRVPLSLPWAFEKTKGKWHAVRSMCPNCTTVLQGRDLVPVLSWLFSGGKCRYCGQKISPRYPVQEIFFAVAGCALLAVFSFFNPVFWCVFLSMPFAVAFAAALLQKKRISVICLIIIALIWTMNFLLF